MRKRCWRDSITWNLKSSRGLELGDWGGSVIVAGMSGICPATETAEMFVSVSEIEEIGEDVA
jgi:hypothetical protein